ncbi:MAG TPA: hypothetical protein ENJ19_08405 [Gammaproteobacteria bacterium]|nr:hypothetical protein [Gammaproteobacteria bacterium]
MKGLLWDLALYVPTVAVLAGIGAKLWFSPNSDWAYLLFFMASYFFFVGANRILKTRLMLLPGAPVAIELDKRKVRLRLRSGECVDLVKDVRFFSEMGGKTFAITGLDLSGKKQQFIIHAGQFPTETDFKDAKSLLAVYR